MNAPATISRLSPLQVAGLRLDAAIARADLALSRTGKGTMQEVERADAAFDRASDEREAAQGIYRHELMKVTGEDAETILSRLAR